ncbi:MAG: Tol-Pal system beta propeller repeat protein TolB [Candidatus Porifericomitaceae bacterium WSBS_2022_MAG_OTU9]
MYMHNVRVLMFALPMMLFSVSSKALEIVIGEGVRQALPLAVVDFSGAVNFDAAAVIRNDLARSGYFQILAGADMPARPRTMAEVDFADWRRIGVENLLIGDVQQVDGSYRLSYQLVDVYKQAQIVAERIDSDNLRLAAHGISDSVMAALSLNKAKVFSNRMAFVSTKATADLTSYLLHISDYDGYNTRVLLDSPEPIISPTFSPSGSSLSYVAFERGATTIYVQDIASGRRQRVSAWPGINGAPAYSPDGSSLATSLSRDGNPEIYVLHLASVTWQRLTSSSAIDTEPAWLPDGKSLVFTSDRSGKPQIYRVQLATGDTRRITFSGEYNASPDISADGSVMATVAAAGNSFHIALFDLAGGELIRIIRTAAPPEAVDFSENGQLLLYSSGNRIGTVPLHGIPDVSISIPGIIDPRQAVWGRRR